MENIIFIAFYLSAGCVLLLHFSGWLEAHNLEWLVFVFAVMVFPVVFLTS